MEENLKTVRRVHHWFVGICAAVLLFSVPVIMDRELQRVTVLLEQHGAQIDALEVAVERATEDIHDEISLQLREALQTHDVGTPERFVRSRLSLTTNSGVPGELTLAEHGAALHELDVTSASLDLVAVRSALVAFQIVTSDLAVTFEADTFDWAPNENTQGQQSWRLVITCGGVDTQALSALSSRMANLRQSLREQDLNIEARVIDEGDPPAIEILSRQADQSINTRVIASVELAPARQSLQNLVQADDGAWDAIKGLTLAEAAAELNRMKNAPPTQLKALGVSVDVEYALTLGTILITITAVFFLAHILHLNAVLNSSMTPMTDCFPWVGFFRGLLGTPLAYGSTVLLPLGSEILLVMAAQPRLDTHVTRGAALLCLAFHLLFVVQVFIKLKAVRSQLQTASASKGER